MACSTTGNCQQAYRKGGSNAVHCKIQQERGGKWDFCAYQYFCKKSNRYEMSAEVAKCRLRHDRKGG
jgi:hypothetical protein